MRAILIINGVDFTPWLRSGGLQQTEIVRQGREVTALDGTVPRPEISSSSKLPPEKYVCPPRTVFAAAEGPET